MPRSIEFCKRVNRSLHTNRNHADTRQFYFICRIFHMDMRYLATVSYCILDGEFWVVLGARVGGSEVWVSSGTLKGNLGTVDVYLLSSKS